MKTNVISSAAVISAGLLLGCTSKGNDSSFGEAASRAQAFGRSKSHRAASHPQRRTSERRAKNHTPKNSRRHEHGPRCDHELGLGTGVQLGPRPYYLVSQMDDSPLKDDLLACEAGPFRKTDFSIGHRGAALQFPEHTKESYEAAARMGAGIIECDVTFTEDRELVCRHAQCDLHTTTNILLTDLANKCSEPFQPADANANTSASAKCCASDITLAEFKTLCGKMDASNPAARTPEEYVQGTANFRTDLYSTCGTLMTHAESIQLIDELDADFTPELKAPEVPMPFGGDYTQEAYAQQMIDEYKAAKIKPSRVWPQSFNLNDVLYWIEKEKKFGRQAVFLDGRDALPGFDVTDPATFEPSMEKLAELGVNVIAPPTWMLVQSLSGKYAPSIYAEEARNAGLDIITWTLERSGPLASGGGWYYQTVNDITKNDGDAYELLDVLAQDVGILGIFSDWPASVTYYANCMGL